MSGVPTVDLVDIVTPNDSHAEIAIAAAEADKMVMCEKPLGRTPAEALRYGYAVERAQVANMVWYNYRRVPAVTLAKEIVDEDALQDLPLSRQVPAGLDNLEGFAAGRRRAVAARCECGRKRRDRRPARPLR